MNEYEKRKKRIQFAVATVVALGFGFTVAPVIMVAIKGLLGIITAFALSSLVIWASPIVGLKFANWRLKALKSEAEENPIETLENQYKEKEQALVEFKSNIEALHAETRNVYDQIKAHREQFPESESEFEPMYQAMVVALNDRVAKYQQVKASLKQFAKVIEQKRSEFKVAQALAKARKAAGVGADFMAKLLEDTAVNAVKSKLNLEFAALETSILDSGAAATAVVHAKPTAALPHHAGPPTLDLEFTETPVLAGRGAT